MTNKNQPKEEILGLPNAYYVILGATLAVIPLAAISIDESKIGKQSFDKDGTQYNVFYDRKKEGVVVMDDFRQNQIQTTLIDTNYDQVADVRYTKAGLDNIKLFIGQEEKNLFSQATSNFYTMYPTRESLFKSMEKK
jgi:hypothetical protein